MVKGLLEIQQNYGTVRDVLGVPKRGVFVGVAGGSWSLDITADSGRGGHREFNNPFLGTLSDSKLFVYYYLRRRL